MRANAKGKAWLEKMMADKIKIREAIRKDPNITEVDGIKLVKIVPARAAAE